MRTREGDWRGLERLSRAGEGCRGAREAGEGWRGLAKGCRGVRAGEGWKGLGGRKGCIGHGGLVGLLHIVVSDGVLYHRAAPCTVGWYTVWCSVLSGTVTYRTIVCCMEESWLALS